MKVARFQGVHNAISIICLRVEMQRTFKGQICFFFFKNLTFFHLLFDRAFQDEWNDNWRSLEVTQGRLQWKINDFF